MRGKLIREGDLFAVLGLVVTLVVCGSPVLMVGLITGFYTWMWATLAGITGMYTFCFAVPGMIATRRR